MSFEDVISEKMYFALLLTCAKAGFFFKSCNQWSFKPQAIQNDQSSLAGKIQIELAVLLRWWLKRLSFKQNIFPEASFTGI